MAIQKIKLSDIHLLDNTRAEIGDLSNLMKSIKESGLIQPIAVAKNFTSSKKPYVLVAGNRRYHALRKLGEKTAAAMITNKVESESDLILLNVSENLQRENVSVYEQGRFIHKLIEEFDMTINECAVRIGVRPQVIKQMLDVYSKTPKQFQNKITYRTNERSKGKISLEAAAKVNTLRKTNLINKTDQTKLLKDLASNALNSSDIRQIDASLRKGLILKEVLEGAKKTAFVQLRIPILIEERDEIQELGHGIQKYVEEIIYGERKDCFTRPRL